MSNEALHDFSIILPRNRKTIYLTELDRRTSSNFIKLARARGVIPSTDIAGTHFTLEQIHKFSTLVNNNTINPNIVAKIHEYVESRPDLIIVTNARNLSSRLTKIVRTTKGLSSVTPIHISRKNAYNKEQLITILGVLSSKTNFEQMLKLTQAITTSLDVLEMLDRNNTPDILKVPYSRILDSQINSNDINSILKYINDV